MAVNQQQQHLQARLLGAWTLISLLGVVLLAGGPPAVRSAEPATSASLSPAQKAAIQGELEHWNGLVGEWRGVGQVMRNSNKDSWQETGAWVWEIKKDRVAIRYDVKEGKHLSSALLTFDPSKKLYRLTATLPDKTERLYTGTKTGNKLALESPADKAGIVHQISITALNEKRTLVLYQTRKTEQEIYTRLAEVGYTRQGTKLAIEGEGEPECIVSGGKGTSTIVYQGTTYYFCCSGCRDAFNADPEGILAEAAQRAKKKAASAKN